MSTGGTWTPGKHHKRTLFNIIDPFGTHLWLKPLDKQADAEAPQVPQAPQAPNVEAIKEDEKKKMQQKLAANTRTTYTSPLGINDDTLNTEKKRLLGG
jgi:hypothetical protein